MEQPRVWAVTFKEFGGADEIVVERRGEKFVHLMYADTAEGYAAALGAFTAVVRDRLGPGRAVFSYPAEFGTDARAHIVVRDSERVEHEDCCGYDGDTIELRPYEVLAG